VSISLDSHPLTEGYWAHTTASCGGPWVPNGPLQWESVFTSWANVRILLGSHPLTEKYFGPIQQHRAAAQWVPNGPLQAYFLSMTCMQRAHASACMRLLSHRGPMVAFRLAVILVLRGIWAYTTASCGSPAGTRWAITS
jgi:hypothetical protein